MPNPADRKNVVVPLWVHSRLVVRREVMAADMGREVALWEVIADLINGPRGRKRSRSGTKGSGGDVPAANPHNPDPA